MAVCLAVLGLDEARGHAERWRDLHREVRKLDDSGDDEKAVAMATADGSTVFGGSTPR